MSRLSLDDSALGDPAAISTPLVAETIRRSARPSNLPDRFQAGLHNITTEEFMSILAQVIENYY